ncbi:hypothetical protein BH23ACT11_BH23ACT11_28860 [soil metagenome]
MSSVDYPHPAVRTVLVAAILALVAAAMFLLRAEPAQAAFPGENGRIAFDSKRDGDHEIYTMNADGTGVKKLTNNSIGDYDPAFSGDGRKIAFMSRRGGRHEIYIMNADGTNQARLTYTATAWDSFPSFSPDGRKIAYSSVRFDTQEIYVMNANGTNQTRLTNHPADDYHPLCPRTGIR